MRHTEAMRRAFHDACVQAVYNRLGTRWSKSGPGPESWTTCFQWSSAAATQVLTLRLEQRRHVVEIVLAVKRDPADPMPRVWWEDRKLHPEATGYRKVLWSGDLTYGVERFIPVPKEPWCPEFASKIEKYLAENRTAIESWYSDAESQLLTGEG